MKKTAWTVIVSYNLHLLFLLALLLVLIRQPLLQVVCSYFSIDAESRFYFPLEFLINICITLFWIYVAFRTVLNTRYTELTGRMLSKDKHDFHKSYSELSYFFTHNNPYQMDIDSLPIEDWQDADGVILCKYEDPDGNYRLVKRESAGKGNLIAFGLPGSGKTTTQAATTAARFNAENGACGVFAISIKGDLLNFVRGRRTNILLFTPDKEDGSCHYDPLYGVAYMDPTERRTFVENMSVIICPEEQGENAAFFYNGARDYFCAVMLYLLYLHDTGQRTGQLKFPEFVDEILSGNVFDITITIRDSGCRMAGEYSNAYEGSSEKNTAGIWNHLCKCVRPFNTGALRTLFDGEGRCITPEDLNHADVYIDVPQEKYQVYSKAMALITTNFIQAFMRRPDVSSQQDTVPILFLLDEAVQINLDFSLLSQAMSTLRSKNVSIFLLMQSIAQLEGRYGNSHAREIIDLCAYISVFNAQDPQSREYFQKLVGRRKMLQKSASSNNAGEKNESSGITVNEVDEYIFEAADFGDLNTVDDDGNMIYRVLVYANGKYILGETTPVMGDTFKG